MAGDNATCVTTAWQPFRKQYVSVSTFAAAILLQYTRQTTRAVFGSQRIDDQENAYARPL